MALQAPSKFSSVDRKDLILGELIRTDPPIITTRLKCTKQAGDPGDECLQFIVLRGWHRWKLSQVAGFLGTSSHSVRSPLTLFYLEAARFSISKIGGVVRSPGEHRKNRCLCRFHGERFMAG